MAMLIPHTAANPPTQHGAIIMSQLCCVKHRVSLACVSLLGHKACLASICNELNATMLSTVHNYGCRVHSVHVSHAAVMINRCGHKFSYQTVIMFAETKLHCQLAWCALMKALQWTDTHSVYACFKRLLGRLFDPATMSSHVLIDGPHHS